MNEYPFDCPICGERYWDEVSIMHSESYGDSVCFRCVDEVDGEEEE